MSRGSWIFAPLLLGCGPELPPAPAPAPAGPALTGEAGAAASASFLPGTDAAVFTYAGERGVFTDASKVEDVPEDARKLVRVALLGGQEPPPGQVFVADLGVKDPAGRIALNTVPRGDFEELALGQGRSSQVEVPDGEPGGSGGGPGPALEPDAGAVVVYKTAWCGVCKKLEGYLQRKGVEYAAKDIEKDPAAAAELRAKATRAGVRTGSVPVIDVGGELLVGFDRARLERILPNRS
jgi:glutaredoxin